jgi:hypothetical protein
LPAVDLSQLVEFPDPCSVNQSPEEHGTNIGTDEIYGGNRYGNMGRIILYGPDAGKDELPGTKTCNGDREKGKNI